MIDLDEVLPPTDCQERTLWRRVVLQTIEDATRWALGLHLLDQADTGEDEDGADALRMIRTGSPDWYGICELADAPADLIRERVLLMIEEGRAINTRQTIGRRRAA